MSITSERIREQPFFHALADDAAEEIETLEKEIDQLRAENASLKAELAEVKKDASRWFSLVMNAAAELEDAANCLHDSDAKKNAQSAAKYYRGEAMKGK